MRAVWGASKRGVVAGLLIAWVLLISTSAFAQHTYYISKSLGSDSRTPTQAQSKSTPWAHVPGMQSCASNCASYTPAAGDNFILYGGDSWLAADLAINTCPSGCWNGSVGNPISITVDKTWYNSSVCGGSWCRPIFNLQNSTGTLVGGSVVWLYSDYWVFDNVEITGYQQSGGGGNVVAIVGTGVEVKNVYIHNFSRTAGSSGSNSVCFVTNGSSGGGGGSSIHDSICDGADSPNQDFMGGILHGNSVYNNVIRYVYNGMNGAFNDIHGNLIEHNYISTSGDHCNMIFPQGTFSGETIKIYNNVIRNKTCGTTLFTLANSNDTNLIAYQYNNVLYDNASGNDGIGSGGHDPTGVYYDYNNTVVSLDNCFGNGEAPATKSVTHYENNHCVAPTVCVAAGTSCVDGGGNLQQTAAQANSNKSPHYDQYTDKQTYAYSPVAASNSTVGAGNNLSSMCSGNLAALCSDTAYATYDQANHTVVMRTVNARPASGAWDIGAYLFQDGPIQPPTGVKATAH